MKRVLTFVLLLLAAGTLAAAMVSCPIDDSAMYPTGRTRAELGKVLWEYKCTRSGHVMWVVTPKRK